MIKIKQIIDEQNKGLCQAKLGKEEISLLLKSTWPPSIRDSVNANEIKELNSICI